MSNKLLQYLLCLLCLLTLATAVSAQRRRTPTKKSKPATTTTTNVAEIKSGAEKVSTQIKNVSKFLFVLGDVARVIEDLDKDIASGRGSRNARDLSAKSRQSVITTIKNLRAGLAALEVEFRTKSALRLYLLNIQGISDMAGIAEDQASDGQLTESGKTLLMVVERLSDTLAALP